MEIRRNSKGEKLYPFSMLRYGHNIELAYNHQYIIVHEMYDGDREWNDEAIKYYETLETVYSHAMGYPIYWCNGKEYGILKEASTWAECYRDERNANR